jgi:hypothetical protein
MADDIRAKRAERVRQQRARRALPQYKWYIVGAIVLVAIVAAALLYKGPPIERFAHEHASYMIYVQGEPVSFAHPAYDISSVSERVHMHINEQGGGAIWHLEARFPNGIPDLSMRRIFSYYGLDFGVGHLRLDTADNHNGSEFRDQGNQTWQVLVSKLLPDAKNATVRDSFRPLTGDYTAYTPRDGDKILITYGDPTPDELLRQEASIPPVPGVEPQTSQPQA